MKDVRARIAAVQTRMRLQRGFEAATLAAVAAGALLCGCVFAMRMGWLDPGVLGLLLALAMAVPLGLGAARATQKVDALDAARALDRANDLEDRLSTAWSLSQTRNGNPWVLMVVRDAERVASRANVAAASPWRVPRDLRALGLVALALVITWSMVFPAPEVAAVEVPVERYLEVAPWELERSKREAERLYDEVKALGDPELTRAADDLRKVWADVDARAVDKDEAFARLAAVDEKLPGKPGTFDEIRDGLKDAGKALVRSGGLEDLGRALDREDFDAARDELEKLAADLKSGVVSAKDMKSMAKSMDAAAKALRKDMDAMDKRMDSLRKDIASLESKPEDERTDEDKRTLKRKKDELDKLADEMEAKAEERKMLERLSRDMEDLAEMLKKMDAAGAADAAQSLGDDMGGMEAKLDRSDALEKLKKALAEGKLTVARGRSKQKGEGEDESDGGEGKDEGDGAGMAELKMRRFMAGETPGAGVGVGEGSSGGTGGSDPGGSSGKKEGDGTEGPSEEKGEGTDGRGMEEEHAEGGGGEEKGPSSSTPGGGDEGGGGGEDSGDTTGSEVRDSHLGPAGFDEVDVPGKRSPGPVRTRIMLGAARKGFSERGYEKLYEAAAAEAEDSMEETRVPLGYRVFVRRYMEVIRPR